jgi:Sugar kinases, ribokinase family
MIFCVGSINLDFITRVEKLPKVGETVLGEDLMIFPGGKGANQALAASRAGSDVKLIGAVGRDQNKEPALSNINESDINTSCIFISKSKHGSGIYIYCSGW